MNVRVRLESGHKLSSRQSRQSLLSHGPHVMTMDLGMQCGRTHMTAAAGTTRPAEIVREIPEGIKALHPLSIFNPRTEMFLKL
jgi:hypothetical protein